MLHFATNATNATIETGKINISFASNEMFDCGASNFFLKNFVFYLVE